MILGIDISHYQKTVDWRRVIEDKIEFAFCKASQGTSFVDPMFEQHMYGAETVGILTGSYHFLTSEDGVLQAEHYYKTVEKARALYGIKHLLSPVADIEENPADNSLPTPDIVKDFTNRLTELWKEPIIYTRRALLDKVIPQENWGKYKLWLADYSGMFKEPENWPVVLWQYGQEWVNGIGKDVDRDIFFGNLSEFAQKLDINVYNMHKEKLVYNSTLIDNIVAKLDYLLRTYDTSGEIKPVYGRVTAKTLNVRTEPTTNAHVIRKLPEGSLVKIFDVLGKWYRIGENEWVYSDYIERVAL